MILAVDESGSFELGSPKLSFLVTVHIRQRKTLLKSKQAAFEKWERALPPSLKNAKGEIKSSSLSGKHLEAFAAEVIRSHYRVGITPLAIRPSENPLSVVEKYRSTQVMQIRDGCRMYAEQGKHGLAKTYEHFWHWYDRLSYPQYLKLTLLGRCITSSLINTVGHAISGGYDEELVRMRYMLDRDFIKGPEQNAFWREMLRNQIYSFTRDDPLPLLNTWKRKGHPFLARYAPDGRINLSEMFWDGCSFLESRDHFEIRIADAVATILSRACNGDIGGAAYDLIQPCFLRGGSITQFSLVDFDVSTYRYRREDNPWLKGNEDATTLRP
jgi:hypothetical protein